MGVLGSDGRPYSPEDQKRLYRALFLLEQRCLVVSIAALDIPLLQEWHTQLSAGLSRMQPGQLRRSEITFGSQFGTAPERIVGELEALIARHHQVLAHWTDTSPDEDTVLYHATWLHAELLRIHPFWDGNGRLSRLIQSWLCWKHDQTAPNYADRPAYIGGLNRYHHTRNLSLLMEVTRQSLPPE